MQNAQGDIIESAWSMWRASFVCTDTRKLAACANTDTHAHEYTNPYQSLFCDLEGGVD